MMSKGLSTPEKIKNKIINLKIELNAPAYGDDGKLLHPEDEESEKSEDEEIDDKLAQYFSAHLLDEDLLNSQIYEGSMSSYEGSDEEKVGKQQEYIPSTETNIINKPRDEADIEADFKKHMNLDFD